MSQRLLIDHGRLIDALRIECDLLLDAARRTHHDSRIPACPGLNVGETVRHLGSVYRMARQWLVDGVRPDRWQRDPEPGEALDAYLRSGLEMLVSELAARQPESPAGTWWPEDRTAGFWRRRMAHETAIHRVDVQGAARVPLDPVDDVFALDGIDEVLTLWFGYRLGVLGVSGTRVGSLMVSAGDHRWLCQASQARTQARRLGPAEEARVDAHISGAPMQVYLWLWGRATTAAISTDGDEDSIAQVWALLRLATR